MKTRSRLLTSAAALGFAAAMAAPASAQPTQEGLVNVNLTDVFIAVPIALAANICDTNVNALAQQRAMGPVECDAAATSGTYGMGSSDRSGNTNQRGLINVNVEDITLLVPISVAANLCETNVNVLAEQRKMGNTTCTAEGTAIATP